MAAFFDSLKPALLDVKRFQDAVERDVGQFNVRKLDKILERVRKEGEAEFRRMFAVLSKQHFPKAKSTTDIPRILALELQRHINRWNQTLRTAGGTAKDSIPEYRNPVRAKMKDGTRKSILARLDKALGRGDAEPPLLTRTDRIQQVYLDLEQPKVFDVHRLMPKLGNTAVTDIKLSQLEVSGRASPARVRAARLDRPIIVVRLSSGRFGVIDGYHRAAKARKLKNRTIKAIIVSRKLLDTTELKQDKWNPKLKNIQRAGGRSLYGKARLNGRRNRKVLIRLYQYLKLLVGTAPANFKRDFKLDLLRITRQRGTKILVKLTGGVGPNSCSTCRALNGRILTEDAHRYATEFLNPPLYHPNCFTGDTPVWSGHDIEAGYRAWYDGQLIVIKTSSGLDLSVTPNHPVATIRGWVAAGELKDTDKLLTDRSWVEREQSVRPDDDQMVARIADVFGAVEKSGSVSAICVPASTENLYGDVADSDVDIVLTNSFLWGDLIAALRNNSRQGSLCKRNISGLSLASLCSSIKNFGRILLSPSRFVRCCRTLLALHGRAPRSTPVRSLATRDGGSTSVDDTGDRWLTDSVFATNISLRSATAIQLDHIEFLGVREFAGHVYTLQTKTGLYHAGGIVVKNCRHSVNTGGMQGVTMTTYDPSTHGELITVPVLNRMVSAGLLSRGKRRRAFVRT